MERAPGDDTTRMESRFRNWQIVMIALMVVGYSGYYLCRSNFSVSLPSIIEELAARHANLGVTSGRQAIEAAAEPLETRGIVVLERGRFRVRERNVLRYYARSIEHLLTTSGRTH